MADDRIQGFKINSAGYGTIPKAVMQDRNLNISAKALYAYFCSFTGAGDTCFPTRKKICLDLGISNDTLGKQLRQLVDNGYILVEQIKENGRFSHNVYTLPSEILPLPKFSDTEKTGNGIIGNGDLDTKNNNNFKNNNSKNNNNTKNDIDDVSQVKDLYNNICKSYPKCTVLSETRKNTILARLKTFTVDQFKTVFEKAEASAFLKGEVKSKGHENWKANFDWLIKESNFIKVLEGTYDTNRKDNTGYDRKFEPTEIDGHIF